MLAQLLIRNFAIIDQTELELSAGMTALTGETGAGKSILLDALGLVLGDRADTDSIRDGSRKAEITAVFHPTEHSPVWQWLNDHDLDHGDECILRRIISRDNRSRAYINGSPVALQMMRTAGEMLVNIHGQHEHQYLTRGDYQRQLLDQHARNKKLLDQLYAAYKDWEAANQRYEDMRTQISRREQRIDLLRFQAQEFESLELHADELQTIESDHRRAANAGHLYELGSRAIDGLYEGEQSVYTMLNAIEQTVSELVNLDESASDYLSMINSASIQCSEAAAGLKSWLGNIDADPARQQWLEERLAALHHMARKHQVQLDGLLEAAETVNNELAELDSADMTLESLDKQRLEKESDYRQIADKLSRSRKKAAKIMSREISDAMQNLAMKGGVFDIAVSERTSSRPAISGLDEIDFLVSANPGQKPRTLGKVASGGELSRISLAIQLIAARHQVLESMIFDEVDSGVGGAVAETVGQYLRKLSASTQVLCVTHLPQVASQAHHHYRVSKESDDRHTETRLTALDKKETVEEIARMLGGQTITRQTRNHAREMLENVAD